MHSASCRLSAVLLSWLTVSALSGCVPAQVVQYTAFHNRDFSERKKPAEQQTRPAKEMLQTGYLLIGHIDLRRNVRTCYEDNQCVNHSDPTLSMEALQAEAAKRGGDVLTLLEDRTIIETHNKSVCTNYSTTTTVVNNVPIVSTYCSASRTVPGKREARISRALIWRNDPITARGEANARAIESALKVMENTAQADASMGLSPEPGALTSIKPGEGSTHAGAGAKLDELGMQIVTGIRANDNTLLYALARDGRLQKWRDNKGRTALMVSILIGQTEATHTLLAISRGVDRQDNNGLTALHYALMRSDPAMVQKLVDAGYDLKALGPKLTPALHFAIFNPKPENFDWMLEQGFDPNQIAGESGTTSLMLAASEGKTALIQRLIALGVNINAYNKKGHTALMYAAIRDKPDTLKLLMQKGATLDTRDNFQQNALHHAAMSGRKQSIQVMLQKGMDMNAVNNKGASPLVLAMAMGHWEVAEELILRGAKLVTDKVAAEDVALILISKNNPKLLKRYIDTFPPLRELAQRDPNFLQYAAKFSGRETIRYLTELGARIDRPANDGQTPLFTAVVANNETTVRALLELKANPALRDRTSGQTPLRKATLLGHAKVVATLREFGVRE